MTSEDLKYHAQATWSTFYGLFLFQVKKTTKKPAAILYAKALFKVIIVIKQDFNLPSS